MNWIKEESVIYEKWKAEHPDVLHERQEMGTETPPEWWVRNYVETRLHPFITTQITKARNEALSEAIVAVISINGKIPDPIVKAIRALKTTI